MPASLGSFLFRNSFNKQSHKTLTIIPQEIIHTDLLPRNMFPMLLKKVLERGPQHCFAFLSTPWENGSCNFNTELENSFWEFGKCWDTKRCIFISKSHNTNPHISLRQVCGVLTHPSKHLLSQTALLLSEVLLACLHCSHPIQMRVP